MYSWSFSQYNTHIHWLIHGHMTSNKQTVSRQMSTSGQHLRKRATFFMSEGNSALLPARACDQSVTKGGVIMIHLMFTSSAWHIFQTLFFFFSTKKCWWNVLLYNKSLINDWSLGKQWILFPSNLYVGKQNFPLDQSLSVYCWMILHGEQVPVEDEILKLSYSNPDKRGFSGQNLTWSATWPNKLMENVWDPYLHVY